jgi:hypothetical protein
LYVSALSTEASVARARCNALFTDGTDVSSNSATSLADQLNTSRRMSTARWRGGRFCSAATNASRMLSRATATSAGSLRSGSTRLSGIGPIQIESGSGSFGIASAVEDGPRSIGRARRCALPSMSRQTFVAIR